MKACIGYGLWIVLGIVAATQRVATAHEGHAGRTATRPALAVSAAFDPGGSLWVVGVTREGRLYVRRSGAEPADLGAPRVLETGSDRIAADGESRPKIAFGPRGEAVITYTQPLGRPYTGEIRMLRSEDGGHTFTPPFTVHADRQEIAHRFDAVAFDARGVLHTFWIDKRDAEARRAGGRAPRGAAAYRGAAIYGNTSTDGGRTFSPDRKLADHSCECCRIALAPLDAGVAALWRHVYAPNERDHGFTVFADGVSVASPVRATYDRWALDACPHHGPGLARASDGGYHAVWFGERGGRAAVRYGRLDAAGAPHGAAVELPDRSAEHADVKSRGPSVVVTWRSYDGQATRWRAWLSGDGGRSFRLRELGASAGANDHPVLVASQHAIYGLWNTAHGLQVLRLAD